jgi:hypothetical protein
LAFNERPDHPEVHTCLKSNIVSAEVDGQVSIIYNYESKVDGKIVKAQVISKTSQDGLFYGVWKEDNSAIWSGEFNAILKILVVLLQKALHFNVRLSTLSKNCEKIVSYILRLH